MLILGHQESERTGYSPIFEVESSKYSYVMQEVDTRRKSSTEDDGIKILYI